MIRGTDVDELGDAGGGGRGGVKSTVRIGRLTWAASEVSMSQPLVAADSTIQPKLLSPAAQCCSDVFTSKFLGPSVGLMSVASGGKPDASPSEACTPPIEPNVFHVAVLSLQLASMR